MLRAVFLKKKQFSKEKAFPLAKRAKALSRNKEIPISFTKKVFLESILSAKDVNLILLHKLKYQMDGFHAKNWPNLRQLFLKNTFNLTLIRPAQISIKNFNINSQCLRLFVTSPT